ADEPTGNLDSESAGDVMDLLDHLMDTQAVTVVVATHDPEVARHARRRLRLRDGRLLDDGSPSAPTPEGTQVAEVVVDPTGAVRYWSDGAARLFGPSAGAAAGHPLDDVVPGAGRVLGWAALAQAEPAGSVGDRAAVTALRMADGATAPVAVRVSALRGQRGALVAVACVWWRPGPDDEGLPVVD
ncbi:MAG TPA: PAS domain-containing protein, partial [Acidimicrobiales bacterium]|nr:PAS domain-containing protein [Acidimicrobiales bacterium]